jgi:hypothetical protein
MYSLKKIVSLSVALLALAVIAVFVTTGTVGASPRLNTVAAAPLPPSVPVNVVNTPLPVTGTVNANINGTPTVNVASLPAVQINGTASVNVASSSALPVFVEEGYSARNAVGSECDAAFDNNGQLNCLLATVPTGHTLVIETITCAIGVASGSQVVPVVLNMGGPPIGGGNPISLNHRLLLTKAASIGSLDYYGLTTPVKMYAAATAGGSTGVYVSMQVGPGTANQGNGECAISGYLVAQ